MRAIAIASLVPAALLVPGHPLASGGLPGLAAGLLIGAIAGAPAARAESLASPVPGGLPARLAEVSGVLAVGAALGPVASTAGNFVGCALGLLLVGGALSRWGTRAHGALLLVSAVSLVVAVGSSVGPVGPWTLLEPRWEAAQQGASIGLLIGALLAGVGFRAWSDVPWIPGVTGRRPFAAVGLGALAGLLALVDVAWRAETSAVVPMVLSTSGAVAVALLGLSTAGTFLGYARGWVRNAVAMSLATAWFAGPAHDIGPWFWCALLPLGLAIPLAMGAGASRWLAAAIGVGVALSWPGIPASPGDAVAAALTGVAGFWAVATAPLLERKAA